MSGAKLYVGISLLIGGIAAGSCVSRPVPPPPPPPVTPAPSPPPPRWPSQLQARLALTDFANEMVGLKKSKKGTRGSDLLGSSVKEQISRALTQTGAFTVIEQPSQRPASTSRKSKELDKNEAASGNQGEPELILSGTLNTYAPSQTSLDAGMSADPLLGVKQGIAAEKLFRALSDRVTQGPDRIALEVDLADAKTRGSIKQESFECVPPDWDNVPTDIFGDRLRASFSPPQTPMQQATQACFAKIINWIGDQYVTWRASPRPEVIVSDPKIKTIQQRLNDLGYDCGKPDGLQGARTKECIAKFSREKKIPEGDLDALQVAIGKELAERAKKPKSPQLGSMKPSGSQGGEQTQPPTELPETWDK